MTIREEEKEDFESIEKVIKEAFSDEEFSDKKEHELVKRLRESEVFIPELSLVYVDGKNIIGHILLTKITIKNEDQSFEALALAPLSVLPNYQNKGIGSQLMERAIEKAKELNYKAIVVLGHEHYYPKFGFLKASKWNIKAPFEVPDEVFMALELEKESLKGIHGVVEYSPAFFE